MHLDLTPESAPLPALILLFKDSAHPIWNSRSSAIVEDMEEALPGTFVTTAYLAGAGPGVGDALAAARYMDCRAAVVARIDSPADTSRGTVQPLLNDAWVQVTMIRCLDNAGAVASAYLEVTDEPAAEAATSA
jgi:hypothetical protein